MKSATYGHCYRITLDKNTLIIDRVRALRDDACDTRDASGRVADELDAKRGLVHAIVSWLRPKVVYTDNRGPESVRLLRACERLGIVVIEPSVHTPQAKGSAERVRVQSRRGAR